MKRKVFFALVFFSLGFLFFSQGTDSEFGTQSANRQTALRYLRLAKTYTLQGDWTSASETAEAGNRYDASVADLWYLMALSRYNIGATRKEVIPILREAMGGAEWVDYNKNSARIFYADLLCLTGKPAEAIAVLDERPFIYSADAEYIRSRAYYMLGDNANVQRAREKIDVCRRIYPSDARFAYIFFAYEYKIMYSKNKEAASFDYMPLPQNARRIADYFIARISDYNTDDSELEMFAAIFAEGTQKTRLLMAFDAKGSKSPLYAAAALEDEVFSEREALEYFLDFMEEGMDLSEFERFALLLKDEEVRRDFATYMNSYNGTLYCDTNKNLEINLSVVYQRGRPSKVLFDRDNDGVYDWTCDCDFGVPKSARFDDKKIHILYGSYPSPVRVVFEEVPGEEGTSGVSTTIFNIADEAVSAEIFKIQPDEFFIAAGYGIDFYIVDDTTLWEKDAIFDQDALLRSINSMEKPSKERDGATVRFSMLNGVPYAADYIVGEKMYAHAQFASPLIRNVDVDGDGIFETTEIYAPLTSGIEISKADLDAATQNIWGSAAEKSGVYLQMVQVDTNNDTRPDFTEEYLTGGGRISTWDLDFDGEWDSRHTIHSKKEGEPTRESTEIFIQDPKNERTLVTIRKLAGEVERIEFGGIDIPVTKGVQDGFYWLGTRGTESQELNVMGTVLSAQPGILTQIEENTLYIQAVFIDSKIFARILEKKKNE